MRRRFKHPTRFLISFSLLAAAGVAWLNVYFSSTHHPSPQQEKYKLISNTVHALGEFSQEKDAQLKMEELQFGRTSVVTHENQRDSIAEALSSASSWQMFVSSDPPYTDFAPKLDVIWSRGWYNAQFPVKGIPIAYYNEKGRGTRTSPQRDIVSMFQQVERFCSTQNDDNSQNRTTYIYVRRADLSQFSNILSSSHTGCNISLISSDGDEPIQANDRMVKTILRHVHRCYAQNLVGPPHPKLVPIPIGMNFHAGFHGSPHTADTVQHMDRIRTQQMHREFSTRPNKILLDFYSTTHASRRETVEILSQCGLQQSPSRNQTNTWRDYTSYQFGIAPRGNGEDTHRFWEYLLFGVVPISKSGPLDSMLLESHVPVVIVDDWSEVCEWLRNPDQYNQLVSRYAGWIRNAHLWLKPDLWVPRNQARMNELCRLSTGCEETYQQNGRFHPTFLPEEQLPQ